MRERDDDVQGVRGGVQRGQLRCPWCARPAVLLQVGGAEQCSECGRVVYGSDEGAERSGQLVG